MGTAEEVDPSKRKQTPIKWPAVIVLFCVMTSEGMLASYYYAFNPLMCRNQFHIEEASVGYYVGFLTTGYFIGQLMTNLPLGWLSDKIGRRPVLLGGLFSNFIFQLAFGFSTSIWFAIIVRVLNGLLNGSFIVSKCYIREITDETNQAKVFSFRVIGFSIGTIFGPIIGGIFAKPQNENIFPDFFAHEIFQIYPYILPTLITASVNIIGFAIGFFFLPETLPRLVKNKDKSKIIDVDLESGKEIELEVFSSDESTLITPEDHETVQIELTDNFESNNEKTNKSLTDNLSLEEQESFNTQKEDEINFPFDQEDKEATTEQSEETIVKKKGRFAFLNKDLMICMLLYAGQAYYYSIFQQIYPLWAVRSIATGGLGFENLQIGILDTIIAVIPFSFLLFLFPRIERKIGTTYSFRLGACLFAPGVVLVPFCTFLIHHEILMWPAVIACIGIASSGSICAFTSLNLMINNASTPDILGKVNGLSNSIAALLRIIAPVTAPPLFAFIANSSIMLPLNVMPVFFISSSLAFGCFCLSWVVPKYINRHRAECVKEELKK